MRRRRAPRALIAAAVCALAMPPCAARADQVVLEPITDNTIYEEGALSNGLGTGLFAGVTGGNNRRRALLAFNVAAALPAGSSVSSARLELRVTRSISGNRSMTLHRVLANWGEGTSNAAQEEGTGAAATPGDATWAFRLFDTEMWVTAGGDFVSEPSATQVVGNSGPFTWGSTAAMVADVQGWLDAPATSFGWIVLGVESNTTTAKRFGSRQASSVSRPKLTIEFEPPVAGMTPTATSMPTAVATATATMAPATTTATATIARATATATIAAPTATDTAAAATPTPTDQLAPTATATTTAPPTTTATEIPLATATMTPSPVSECVGDCDGDGAVTINELILAVNIALGARALSECEVLDRSGNGTVEINELIAAVNSALSSCS